MKSIIKLLRPKQWLKNGFVFAALVFSGNLFAINMLLRTLLGVIAFCLISSCVYILNDIMDREKDKMHPKKCMRPIASGAVGVPLALGVFAFLLICGAALAFYLNPTFAAVLSVYFVINIAYSLGLKNIAVLDIMCIAMGFVLRALSGSFLIDVGISPWLILCTLMLALFIAIHKRMAEMQHSIMNKEGESRKVLQFYTPEMLRDMSSAIDSATIICYCLYTVNLDNALIMMCTIPFVIFGVFRYQYIIHTNALAETPELALLQDKPLLIDVALWVLLCIVALYIL